MPSIAALSPYGFKELGLDNSETSVESNSDTESTYRCRHSTNYKPLFRAIFENQPTYAQYMKLLALFLIAAVHYAYMSSFLDAFSAIADYADAISMKVKIEQSFPLRHQIEILADYKKNMWLTVGSMCVSLSTSCFFLLLATSSQNSVYITVMRIVDLVAFATLPALLVARSILVKTLNERLPDVLHKMQLYLFPSQITDSLRCSVVERENVPLCSALILNSIFPPFLIKYLIVLAVMTTAYLAVAYIIDWAIKHCFSKTKPSRRSHPIYTAVLIAP